MSIKPSPLRNEEYERKVRLCEDYRREVGALVTLPEFDLSCPVKLPVKSGPSYSTKAFIGGESLTPKGAYVGKKGEIIWTFTPTYRSAGFDSVEIPESKINDLLDGFDEWFSELEMKGEDADRAIIRDEAAEIEERAHREALAKIHAEDSRFGSW